MNSVQAHLNAMDNGAPVAVGLAVGVAFIMVLALALSPGTSISKVIIAEGSSLESAERNNFEPTHIRVVIGVSNTVQWINQDVVPHSIEADDEGDCDFCRATQDIFLIPGATFEYTFTKPGELDYHGLPHSHMGVRLWCWSASAPACLRRIPRNSPLQQSRASAPADV